MPSTARNIPLQNKTKQMIYDESIQLHNKNSAAKQNQNQEVDDVEDLVMQAEIELGMQQVDPEK